MIAALVLFRLLPAVQLTLSSGSTPVETGASYTVTTTGGEIVFGTVLDATRTSLEILDPEQNDYHLESRSLARVEPGDKRPPGDQGAGLHRPVTPTPTPTPLQPLKGLSTEGYQAARWGMSKGEVKSAFPKVHPAKDDLALEQPVAGHPASTVFAFAQGKLSEVRIAFQESHPRSNQYLDDYRDLKTQLSRKYGEAKSATRWSDELYSATDPSAWGNEVAVGHLVLTSDWETPKTALELTLKGAGHQLELSLRYWSKELQLSAEPAGAATPTDSGL